jgi:PilZ domain
LIPELKNSFLYVELGQMRRLKHQQRVEIHLDGADGVVACRVLGVKGSVASLTQVDGGPEQFERVTPAAPGYLMFEHRGGTIALKGIATTQATDQPELLFVVLDGVQLPERRSAERVQVSALARMFVPDGADDDEFVETPLANVSTSGLLVQRHPGLDERAQFRLELLVDGDAEPICCDVVVARRTATHMGMRLVNMDQADQERLAAVIRRHTA